MRRLFEVRCLFEVWNLFNDLWYYCQEEETLRFVAIETISYQYLHQTRQHGKKQISSFPMLCHLVVLYRFQQNKQYYYYDAN